MPHSPQLPLREPAVEQPQAQLSALFNQGLVLHQQGQLTQAKLIYEQVLAKQPQHLDALFLSGVIAARSKNPTLAVELISEAIAIKPDHAEAHSILGIALKDLERETEAIASYDRAIAIKPDYAEAHYNRGNALKELERLEEAVASYDKAISIKPDYAKAYYNRGVALNELNQVEEAVASYDSAIAIKPDYTMAHSNRGVALQELRRSEEAIASFDRVIAINADNAEAHSNRGVALQELKHAEEAVASYDRAIAIKSEYAEAYSNRGNALKELKQVKEAVASYDRAIAIKPEYADAYWNKALALLLTGNFAHGWELYEWRWKNGRTALKSDNFPQPLWLGAEDIASKTILLHAEQGLGDTIQFCRYTKLVKALGAKVILEVPQALRSLLSGLEGADELIEEGEALPTFDYHCPLLSLPLAFNTDLTNIPSPKPYIAASAQKRNEWAQSLGAKDKPRVGLVWSGNVTYKNDYNRSLPLKQLLPHLPNCCEYVSLQKQVREVDKTLLEGSGIRHYAENLKDFTDTAALCDLMDIVITVDTSVAHLSGALGKKTWIILPYSPDWRWLLDRDDSPWYESVRLYRQGADRQYAPVLQRVANDLLNLFSEKNILRQRSPKTLGHFGSI
jgi:hypothetical protein